MKKGEAIYVRADKALIERLRRVAADVDRPASQIVREAVKRELDSLCRRKNGWRHNDNGWWWRKDWPPAANCIRFADVPDFDELRAAALEMRRLENEMWNCVEAEHDAKQSAFEAALLQFNGLADKVLADELPTAPRVTNGVYTGSEATKMLADAGYEPVDDPPSPARR